MFSLTFWELVGGIGLQPRSAGRQAPDRRAYNGRRYFKEVPTRSVACPAAETCSRPGRAHMAYGQTVRTQEDE